MVLNPFCDKTLQMQSILRGIHSHKWVCSTVDHQFHFNMLYRWMRIEQVQRASSQFENLNARLGPALDLKPCSLAQRIGSIRIQQDGRWKGIGIGFSSMNSPKNVTILCNTGTLVCKLISHHELWTRVATRKVETARRPNRRLLFIESSLNQATQCKTTGPGLSDELRGAPVIFRVGPPNNCLVSSRYSPFNGFPRELGNNLHSAVCTEYTPRGNQQATESPYRLKAA